jgi:hypothetical protein
MDLSLLGHPRPTPMPIRIGCHQHLGLMPGNRIARIMSQPRLSPAIIFSPIS